jgi:hypothetical protein
VECPTCQAEHRCTPGKQWCVVCGSRWFWGDGNTPTMLEVPARAKSHAALREAAEFGLSRLCDPEALDTDPAAVRFKAMAEAALNAAPK